MINPACSQCPKCKKFIFELTLAYRTRLDDRGIPKPSGMFWSCECGAYTRSPQTGQYNLKSSVAKKYGVQRLEPLDPTPKPAPRAVPPKIRRKKKAA